MLLLLPLGRLELYPLQITPRCQRSRNDILALNQKVIELVPPSTVGRSNPRFFGLPMAVNEVTPGRAVM